MTCPRDSGTERRNARGIVVASSIRNTLAAPHLSEVPRHCPMLVKLILFVLPFLPLVWTLANAIAVYGDSHIMYSP